MLKDKKKKKNFFKNKHPYLFLLPAVTIGGILILFPLILTLLYSFSTFDSTTMTYDANRVKAIIQQQEVSLEFSEKVKLIEQEFNQYLAGLPGKINLERNQTVKSVYLKKEKLKVDQIKNLKNEIIDKVYLSEAVIDKIESKYDDDKKIEKQKKKAQNKFIERKLKSFSYQVSISERPVTVKDEYLNRSQTKKVDEILKISNEILKEINLSISASRGSLEREKTKKGVEFSGIKNYKRVISEPLDFDNPANKNKSFSEIFFNSDFIKVLIQTVIWTIVCVFFQFVLGLYLAIHVNKKVKGNLIYRTMLMIPWTVPQVVAAISWRFLYWKENGIINETLRFIGAGEINFLGDSAWLLPACIIVNIWLGIPFQMITLLGALQSIDSALYEAASIDGASKWQQFLNVTVPGIKKIASVAILLSVIWTFNAFAIIYLVTLGNDSISKDILITYAYEEFANGFYNIASTYAVVILFILLFFGLFYIKTLEKDGEI